MAGTGGRHATEPLREHQIVYAGYDRPWAAWAERVLASHGYRVLLTRWHPGRRPLFDALTALRGFDPTQPPTGKIVLMLSENLLQFGIRDPDEWREAFRRVVATSPGLFAAVVIGERLELRLRLSELLPVATTAVSVGEADAERRLLTALSLDNEAGDGPRRPVTTRFPGVRPGVWRGVPRRDEHFTGRDDLLDALPEKLRQARRAGAVCVLRGEPGSGKTAIAAEYAHRYSSEYDVVHWVPSGGDQYGRLAELAAGFGKITQQSSGLPVQDRRLIVLDGWDDGSAAAMPLSMPSLAQHAHLLLTSRGGQHSPIPERVVPVGPFRRTESVEYLMHMLGVTAEAAEAMARSCADQPAVLRRAVEGWQESEASLPGPAAADRSVRVEMEALSRRCVVSIGGSKTRPSPRGNGFFVAPGWVLTLWPVVGDHGKSVVVRTHDGRSVTGEVVRLDSEFEGPDPVLVRLRERFDHDCLWLDDHAGTDFRTVLALGAAGAGSRLERWLRWGTVIGQADLLRIRGFRVPANSMGGPVLDLDRAAVVGAVWGPADAVHSDETLAVPLPLLGDGRLAHEVMREHDLYHLRRHLDTQSSGDACWTSIQQRLHRGAPDDFMPEPRTLLYGILATLEPPSQPQDVLDLLPGPQSGAPDEGLLAWRDGVRLLISRGHGPADIALYAARVWSSRIAAPDGGDDPSALRMLRTWLEGTARTLPEGTARGQVTGILDDRHAEARMKILVEFRETAGGHRWSVSHYGGPRQWPMGERYGGPVTSGLCEAVSPALDAALRLTEAFDETPQVEFSMPYALLGEPVEEWRTGTPRPDITLGRRARVGVALEESVLPATFLDNPERLLRWAGVTNGPLMPVSVTHEPAPLRVHLMVAPMTCVPVYCGTLGGGGAGLSVLEAAGSNGYGLVLWRRDTTHENCDMFHERAGELVRGAGTAEGLLAAVHELRLRGDDPEAAWARGIAVLYDSPDRPSYIRDDD
ncbi:hypothetical protein FNH08_48010 [Streptomyces spongiae]|uniref:ATP-binding protein n=1 Tax=Streptomyces spongiae TaxID=565072 RepID=A0A5N8XZ67_9ACTN|nr:hypothetical protein [Streptomyces spongiae]